LTERFVSVRGIRLSVREREGSGRVVLFCHATGFHSHCWDRVIACLPDARVLAVDMRGHGQSDKPAWARSGEPAPDPAVRWRDFGEDIAAFVQALELRDVLAVGHSMGGHAVSLAASMVPDAFARLLLIDPVIMRPEYYQGGAYRDHYAAKRRDDWAGPAEMYERFKPRPPFAQWDDRVLHDYCDYALEPAAEGRFRLACPPRFEAGIYANSSHPDSAIFDEIGILKTPVRILRAARSWEPGAQDMALSPTDPLIATRFPKSEEFAFEEHTHFIPMEAPEMVADHVRQLL
jgi:pimeloyl-ACP methyl ester carboxylesterase